MKQVWSFAVLCILCGTVNPAAVWAQSLSAPTIMKIIMEETRKVYQTAVVDKLQRDGTGAAADYSKRTGFVPLPDAFLYDVTQNVFLNNFRSDDQLYTLHIAGGTGAGLTIKETSTTPYERALSIAQVLNNTVRAIRKVYTARVVQKLKLQGAGASREYTSRPGFVPLPAVFVRLIAEQIGQRTGHDLAVTLRSRWNLNQRQGLQDTFERQGWDFLVKQQVDHQATKGSLWGMKWAPYVQVNSTGAVSTLRYLSADPASAPACVTCHNAWERKQEVQARRRQQRVKAGKEFQRHELMGALSIAVPMR